MSTYATYLLVIRSSRTHMLHSPSRNLARCQLAFAAANIIAGNY